MLKKAAKPESTQPAAKRKLTRAERKQIEAVIRQAKGDGKPHTVQDSIPFRNLFPDGLCRLDDRLFSKTIAYEDVNYRLAGPDDQRDIFERLCDFYNGYDPSIGVQMTLCSRHEDRDGSLFGMDAQGDALDDMRAEATCILQTQYERGNNGYVKSKYVTLTIEAESLPAARARFSRIEADTLNRFKVMGAGASVLDGKERLALLHGLLHPEGGKFAFEWDWLPASGLSVKDFIAPSSFEFGETRRFRMGEMYGAVSFLQILAPEIQDRILTDFMDVEGNLLVTMHVHGINQNEAIKMVKRKITDLDAMKIQEQKKAARSGYDMDILPSDLSTYGGAAKNLLQAIEKTVIDRAVQMIYQPYFADPQPENMPVLGDLMDALTAQNIPEANRVAQALDLYVNGSLNFFNHRTTVDIRNRLVCFDIKGLGKNLKKPGMLIVQDAVWNTVTVNRSIGRATVLHFRHL